MDSNPAVPRTILNTKELGKMASQLLEEVERQEHQMATEVSNIRRQADDLFNAATKIGASHSGSNFGYHGTLYYGDFEPPPLGEMFSVEWGGIHGISPDWKKREPDEVKHVIEALASVTFAVVENAIKAPLKSAKQIQREILIQLAPLHQLPDGNRERQLLEGMEHFDWNDSALRNFSIAALKSFPNMTRDSGAISQGLTVVAHTYYQAAATQVTKSCEAIEQFWDLAERLLRQLQLAQNQTLVTQAEPFDASGMMKRYERLKTGALLLAALLSSLIMAGIAEFAVRRWRWEWLLKHPNSYSIQGLSYTVLLLFLSGLFIRKFRNFCWGFALIPLIVGFFQSLGGPR